MKKLIAALAAVALVGGCVKMDKTPPKDLPAYVRIYPGSTQMMTMNLGGLSSVVIQTPAKPNDIITFYRDQASSDGLQESTAAPAAATAGQEQATFADQASGKMLVVVAKPQGDGSVVSLTYKPAPPPAS